MDMARGSSALPASAHTNHGRPSAVSSGLWIYVEVFVLVGQIVASAAVLAASREEIPEAPLSAWIVGYAVGCAASLPLLYWRYTRPTLQFPDRETYPGDGASPPQGAFPTPWDTTMPCPPFSRIDDGESSRFNYGYNLRIAVLMEKLRISLDCFFAIWFVLGNVWVFGSHASAESSPNLFRLCIVFLFFNCISYALPFILCATVCCCLPCLLSLLGFRDNQILSRGASPELVASLPTCNFKTIKATEPRGKCTRNESDSDSSTEGGIIASGTPKERIISAEDATCCICLRKYKDNTDLRELPCLHCFHLECVDQWLTINASCPLCKHILDMDTSREHSSVQASREGSRQEQEEV